MRGIFDLSGHKKRVEALEKESSSEDFWIDQNKAKNINQELAHLKRELEDWGAVEKELNELEGLTALVDHDHAADAPVRKEILERLSKIEPRLHQLEMKAFLGGPYDAGNAILTVQSGAGGVDAQNWAAMLLAMYRKYCEAHGWKVKLAHESYGEQGGVKDATLIIEGDYAYGFLSQEKGVHRLVRVSPFSAQSLRHTSFALVEVMPELPATAEIELRPEDLEVSTFKSSGPGGQHVNKTESAVRIVHRPTGLSASAQTERAQPQNKELAMSLLKAKIMARLVAERKEKIEDLKEKAKPEWGSQIRSYVLHPYKMVKDHRTEFESANPEAVLNGDLDGFIEAALKQVK